MLTKQQKGQAVTWYLDRPVYEELKVAAYEDSRSATQEITHLIRVGLEARKLPLSLGTIKETVVRAIDGEIGEDEFTRGRRSALRFALSLLTDDPDERAT